MILSYVRYSFPAQFWPVILIFKNVPDNPETETVLSGKTLPAPGGGGGDATKV